MNMTVYIYDFHHTVHYVEEGFSTLNNCKDYKKFEKCMMRIITKVLTYNTV